MSIADRVPVKTKNPYAPPGRPDLRALFADMGPGETITWLAAEPDALKLAIHSWTAGGNAITFGCTSDGGALSISLLSGGKPFKLYAKDGDEVDALLKRIAGLTEA